MACAWACTFILRWKNSCSFIDRSVESIDTRKQFQIFGRYTNFHLFREFFFEQNISFASLLQKQYVSYHSHKCLCLFCFFFFYDPISNTEINGTNKQNNEWRERKKNWYMIQFSVMRYKHTSYIVRSITNFRSINVL